MKCPKCHKEVEKGSLYCPYCLAEIPWVKEFDSVETLMKKEQQNRPPQKKSKFKYFNKLKKWKRKKRYIRHISKKQLICLVAFAAILLGALCYRQLHSFSALYSGAKRQYEQQNYERALKIAEDALDLKPESEAANLLLAKSMEKLGDRKSAILVLKPFIRNKTAGVSLYREYVEFLVQNVNTEEVRNVLKHASKEVQDKCSDYICETPVSNPASGTYASVQTLELRADHARIYYTLDGSVPTKDSALYTEPITLREGTTEVKAIGVNDKGIESDMIYRKYVIVLKTPDAPEVTPKSGDYDKKTKIKVTVPDGCKAYYAFDSQPDINSTLYEQPISMPVGYHKLNVILVAANGKVSKVTTMEYYLQY